MKAALIWLGLLIMLSGCGAAATVAPPSPPPAPASTSAPVATVVQVPLQAPLASLDNLQGTLAIDGSSTVFPITEAAAISFARFAPQVQIQLGVSGTGGGFRKFCAGETQIADASRPINAEERAACAAAGIEFVELPVAFDGLSVVVHPSNDWADCLSVAELRTMWQPAAEATITNWQAVRSAWPDRPLALYGAGADSGTFDYFTDAIVGEEGLSRNDYIASEDDYLLAQDLAADPNGLGFFGYAYYAEYRDQLKLVAIDGGAGCVEPSDTTIADGSYQPLARPIFIYVRADQADQPALQAFVDFYLANVARFVGQVGYTPLPAALNELVDARWQQRVTGTVFADETTVGLKLEDLLRLEQR